MIFSLENKQDEQEAICEDTGIITTYGQLRTRLAQFGKQFNERSLVFCLCKNSLGSLIGYLGCLENNQVALLLDAELDKVLMENLFMEYKPAFFWVPREKEEVLADLLGEKIYTDSGYVLFATPNLPYPMNPKLALLLTTSGSTGSPKLVRITMKNIQENAKSIEKYLQLNCKERPITSLPMHYTYGLSVINSHLLAGGCILLTGKSVVMQEFWNFLEEQKATSFAGVPYTFEILKKIKILQQKLPGITSITQAGGKLSKELQMEFGQWSRENGIGFYIMYGQTEATARMSYLPWERCLEKPGSVGIPIPGGSFILKDDNQNIVEEAWRTGELIYKGPNVTMGYAQCFKDLKKGDERQGILETGDLAQRDEDGYYYIVGRKKRFIKIFGIRVGLDECEQLLSNHFCNTEFACTGVDDSLHIYASDEIVTGQSCDWLSQTLHLNRKAFSCCYIEKIPKSDVGKTLYSLLK